MTMSSFSESETPVVVGYRRTPFGLVNGRYKSIRAEGLLGAVLGAIGEVSGPEPTEVIIGNAVGGGGNIARLGLLTAGFPARVSGISIDRQCASGLDAIVLAARMVAAGGDGVYIAGGAESCSTRPLRARRPSSPDGVPEFYERPSFAPDEIGDPDLGVAADTVAKQFGITRQRQDEFALESHRRALVLQGSGALDRELVMPDGGTKRMDEGPRPGLTAKTMERFPPVFSAGGTVTAGNSCRDADGAAVAVIMSARRARSLGFTFWLEFDDAATAGVEPAVAGIAGGVAARTLAEQLNFDPSDCAAVEFNEAFSAQVLASAEIIGVAPDRLNRDGGALAIGHPYGVSGAALVGNLFRQLSSDGVDGVRGLAAVSAAGGLGTAAAFRARVR